MALEGRSGGEDEVKRESGALSDVEERVAAVREIEHPEHRHVPRHSILSAAEARIEPPLAELRLALGGEIDQSAVLLEDFQCLDDPAERNREVLGTYEVEIVG